MSIIYVAIARHQSVILAEYAKLTGNYKENVSDIIKYLQPGRKALSVTRYVFYCETVRDFHYICLCENDYRGRLAWEFLKEIQQQFMEQFLLETSSNAAEGSLTKKFKKTLEERLNYFNTPQCDKIWYAQQNTDETINILVENLQQLLQREAHLQILQAKSENYVIQAKIFRQQATEVERIMWWRNQQIIILIVLVILVIIYGAMVYFCKGFDLPECF